MESTNRLNKTWKPGTQRVVIVQKDSKPCDCHCNVEFFLPEGGEKYEMDSISVRHPVKKGELLVLEATNKFDSCGDLIEEEEGEQSIEPFRIWKIKRTK